MPTPPNMTSASSPMKGFKVYQIDSTTGLVPVYSRRDLYTVCLLTSPCQVQRADQEIALDGTCLFFGYLPAMGREKGATARQTGYVCRFTEAFFKENGQVVSPEQWALFNGHATRAFSLHHEQATYLTTLFQKMLAEQQTAYLYKEELLRAYLQLIIHEALRLRTSTSNCFFRYYFQQPGRAGELVCGWRSRQHRSA